MVSVLIPNPRRRRHPAEGGNQTVEYVGLTSVIGTLMVGAVHYCSLHGSQFGELILNQAKSALGQ